MLHDVFFWAFVSWIAAFGVIEGLALALHDHPLTYFLRLWFRTNTRTGRTVWGCVAGLFFGMLVLHIAGSGLSWW